MGCMLHSWKLPWASSMALLMKKDPGQSKYSGIFFDPELSGEANHRPQWRTPPLRMDNYKRLIELARGRFGEVVEDNIPDGDLHLLMDGGTLMMHGDVSQCDIIAARSGQWSLDADDG